ncbi:MAG: hypothetical protein ACXVLQ_12975 [Bacteriovorax sp.]
MKILMAVMFLMFFNFNSYGRDLIQEFPNNTSSFTALVNENFDQTFFVRGDVEIVKAYLNDQFITGGWGPFLSGTNLIMLVKVKNRAFNKKFFLVTPSKEIMVIDFENRHYNQEIYFSGTDQDGFDYFHVMLKNAKSGVYNLLTLLNSSFKDPGPATIGSENQNALSGWSGNKYEIQFQVTR